MSNFVESVLFQSNDQHRFGWVIGPVQVGGSDDQIRFGIQGGKIAEHRIVLLKAGITALINADGHEASLFQQRKPCCDGRQGRSSFGGDGMPAAGQISQIEGDAADCAGYGVLVYVFVTIQNKTHPVDEPLRTQKLPGSVQGALLNIESDDLTVSTDERGEKMPGVRGR